MIGIAERIHVHEPLLHVFQENDASAQSNLFDMILRHQHISQL